MKRIGIIGAGPGGICAGIRLKQSGFAEFRIFEQAPSVGGTWWHNNYPGCACDVPSHLFSFSFAQRADWLQPYATQPEVQAYLEDCVTRFDLWPHIRLGVAVGAAHWDDASAEWRLQLANGEEFACDVLVSAVGLFNLPAWPEFPGLADFGGTVFHSARWNHAHLLEGRDVAVIGSAASAVQFVPRIAPLVRRLDVYQRTPNWIGPRDDHYTEEQLRHFRADPAAGLAEREMLWQWLNAIQTLDNPEVLAKTREACLRNLEQVEDPEIRRALTPDHPFGAKRGLVSSDWYPTFNRDNVQLVTDAIERITPDAVVTADGTSRAVDTIILATGFDTSRFLSAIPVTGRGGRALEAAWSEGAEAYLGITVSGFPNLFMLYGPNTNNGSILFQIECQVEYLLRHVDRMARERLQWIDVKPEVQAAYNRQLQEDLAAKAVWQSGTRDYYRAPSGKIVTQWPHGMDRYRDMTQASDEGAYWSG